MKIWKLEIPELFEWRVRTKIVYGLGCRADIGKEFDALGASRIMVITDKGVSGTGIIGKVEESFTDSVAKVAIICDELEQDNNIEIINKLYQVAQESGINGILAVGGGSVMDCAKGVNIMLGEGYDDFREVVTILTFPEPKSLLPHIAVPTTAGTGAEVTWALETLDPRQKAKLPVQHVSCASDVALLDPEVTLSLPARITAFTGMDALTHAIEGLASTNANPISDGLALYAIRLISYHLPVAVQDGGNLEARSWMLLASNIAGICFINALIGAVHATAHALGGRYRVPHGLANAIMLPHVMQYNLDFAAEKYALVAEAMGEETRGLSARQAGEKAIDAVEKLKKKIGLADTLSDFKVDRATEEEMDVLVDLAMTDGSMISNPRSPEAEEIKELYRKAM
jgi:alcohol dehydrogenase